MAEDLSVEPGAVIEPTGRTAIDWRGQDGLVLLICYSIFATFVWLTWAQWPLLTADSARELYVPWRILHGQVIYRDFIYLYGPLAPSWQAALLGVFGSHLHVLYLESVLLVAGIGGMVYLLARQFLTPSGAGLVWWLLFTNAMLGRDIGGYFWPYAFAATHAVLLGLLTLWGLMRAEQTRHGFYGVLASVCAGLSVLTKLEYGVAALGVLGWFSLLLIWRFGWRHSVKSLAGLWLPCLLIACSGWGLILAIVPVPTLLDSVWPTELMRLWNSQGTWHGNAVTWQTNVLRFCLTMGLTLGVAFAIARLKPSYLAAFTVLGVGGLTILLQWPTLAGALKFCVSTHHLYWLGPSFLLLSGILFWQVLQIGRERPSPLAVHWSLLGAYGLLVALRTLMTGYNDYTRYQAPVALIAWVALVWVWIPAWLGNHIRTIRAVMAALVVLLGVIHGLDAWRLYRVPHEPVSCRYGTVIADTDYARPFKAAITFLKANLRVGEHVVAAPMEASLYTFTETDNVMREDNLFFGYLTTAQSQNDFINRMQQRHVAYVVVSSYGEPHKRFGIDYMTRLGEWLASDARQVASWRSAVYGLTVYETPWRPGGG